MSRGLRCLLELIAVSGLVLGVTWLRFDRLDRFIASDEVRWTCRAINFKTALEERRWSETLQVGHPGVVTMWLGSLALSSQPLGRWPALCRTTQGGSDLSKLDDEPLAGVLQTVPPLLFRARGGVALGSLLVLVLIYLLLRRFLGIASLTAVCGLAVLALDPFLTAHSRVLHLDGLTSLLILASLLVALGAPRAGPGAWFFSGLLGGLAIANKSAALTLILAAVALALWGHRDGFFPHAGTFEPAEPTSARSADSHPAKATRWPIAPASSLQPWLAVAGAVTLWAGAASVAVVAIWPSMWVAPWATIQAVLAKALAEGAVAHPSGNYFAGRAVADPGPLFYPVAAAFRLTPTAWAGLVCAGLYVACWRRQRSVAAGEAGGMVAGVLMGLFAWAVVFSLLLTPGPKKFDRYLLPALAALNLAAGMGLGLLISWPWQAAQGVARQAGCAPAARPRAALVALALLAHLASVVAAHPYELTYYNPLLGGANGAQRAILVGWGEGYDLAAEWLNRLPGADQLEVTVRGVANFAPLFHGRTRSADGYRPGTTDYVVLYISQLQRQQNPGLLGEYRGPAGPPPAFVGRLAGIDFVWVYSNRSLAELRTLLKARLKPGDVILAGGETAFARHYDWDTPLVRFWGHWTEKEVSEAVEKDFPRDWQRAWLVLYRNEVEAPRLVLESAARREEQLGIASEVATATAYRRVEPGQASRTTQPVWGP